jgi:RHS repeat-associated protein
VKYHIAQARHTRSPERFQHDSRSYWLMLKFLIIGSLLWCSPGLAQDLPDVAMGMNPQATYHSGEFDSVDLATGRLHMNIPLLVDKSQRGRLNFTYALSYTSSAAWVGSGTCGPSSCSWNAGRSLVGVSFIDTNLPVAHQYRYLDPGPPKQNYYENTISEGAWGVGASHDTVGIVPLDGSGFGLNGGVLFPSNLVSPGCGGATDTNGNELTQSFTVVGSETVCTTTDTLGRTWTLTTGTSNVIGCPVAAVNTTTWNIPGPSGTTRAFTFCYSNVQLYVSLPPGSPYTSYGSPISLMTGVILPDGTTWRFDYDSWGDISTVYLPTGGTISYTWTTTTDDPCNGYATAYLRTVASRTEYDGTSYHTSNYSFASTTATPYTMTDPSGNDTVATQYIIPYGPCSGSLSQTQHYSGTGSNRSLLKTVTNTYQRLPDPFPVDLLGNDVALVVPLSSTTQWANGQQTKVTKTYDCGYFSFGDTNDNTTYTSTCPAPATNPTYGLVTSETQYDYGNGAAGPPLSTTNNAYLALSNSSYASAKLLNLVSSKIVADASGNKCSETDYGYDESTPDSSGVNEQHVGPPYSVRGNLTSIKAQLFTSPCSTPTPSETPVTTTKHVYDTGMIHTSSDPLNNPPTTYSYSATYYGAYPTSVCNPLNQCTTYGYDFGTGLMTSMTDLNNQTTTYPNYDTMLRLLQVNFPDRGETKFTYANPTTVEVQRILSGSTWTDSFVYYDGLGRESRRMSVNDESSPYDQTDNCYDANGRLGFKSYPYQGNGLSAAKVCSGAGDSFSYDPLNRVTQVSHSDNSTILTSYAGRATSVQDEGNGTQRVQRISQVDGMGRLTSLCEMSGSLSVGISGSEAASACNLDISGTGFVTTYAYDALNNLKSVSQGPLNSRTLLYDSLSRITQATNPESGTVCYGKYSGNSCQQNGYDADGNLIYKTDARNITTTYSYDQANRLIQKSYSDGITPTYYYAYDSSPTWASGLTNLVGRLVNAYNQYEGTLGKGTLTLYSYDPVGRVLQLQEQTPIDAPGSFVFNYSYDLAGDMTSSTNGLGQTLTYSWNRAQRMTSISTNATGFGPAGSFFGSASSPVRYNAAGSVVSATFGNGVGETRTYDGRLRLTGIADGSVYNLTIPTNGGYAPDSNILAANDSVNGNWTYGYDAFNRLTGAAATGQAYTYAYDRFGNRWQQNGPHSSQPGFDANNHMLPGLGVTYDAAGNTTNDGTTAYTYDAENHIVTAVNPTFGTSSYVYDANGKRVEKTTTAGGTVDFLYDVAGHEIAQINSTSTWTRGEVYVGSRHLATLNNNTTYYSHADWLGTERARSTGAGALYESCTSLPFGDWLTCTGGDPSPMHFTGKEHDNETALDNFGARYNSSQYGRFMSPDPKHDSAVAANPQTLNRYSYGLNNPIRYLDIGGKCASPAVGSGQVGICIESYIQANRMGSFGTKNWFGYGDNRGPIANDPSATYRTQTLVTVDLKSMTVSENTTPGISQVMFLPSKQGLAIGGIPDNSVYMDNDGNLHFEVDVRGLNGFAASGNKLAPQGWIEMQFDFLVDPDGTVFLLEAKSKSYPSVSVYSYSHGQTTDLFQQNESGNPDDLNKPMQDMQVASPIVPESDLEHLENQASCQANGAGACY